MTELTVTFGEAAESNFKVFAAFILTHVSQLYRNLDYYNDVLDILGKCVTHYIAITITMKLHWFSDLKNYRDMKVPGCKINLHIQLKCLSVKTSNFQFTSLSGVLLWSSCNRADSSKKKKRRKN